MVDSTANDFDAVRFRQLRFADMVSSQTNDGDSFFGASQCAIEHVAAAGFCLPPLLGRFHRGLGGCGDRAEDAEDTLASGNSELGESLA